MGDRASIVFRNGKEESVVFCHHWGGQEFQKEAEQYARELVAEKSGEHMNPLDRLEPSIVMVDFIRWYIHNNYSSSERIDSSMYLGKDRTEVDDSDNGCKYIDLKEMATQVAKIKQAIKN